MTALLSSKKPTTNWLSTLSFQTRLEVLALLRNPSSLVPTILFPVMFWVFFGLPNAKQISDQGYSVGAYILASFAMYTAIQTVLFNLGIFIAMERSMGWYRYQRTTPVRVWVMFSSKIISALLMALLAVIFLLIVGSISGGIHLEFSAWISLIVRVMFGSLPFAALAVAIGYYAKNANSASPIINLIFFPMSFGSGLFVPLESLPTVIQKIAPFLPSYHGGMLARVVVGAPSASSQIIHALWIIGFTVLFLMLATWAYRKDEGSNYR